MVARVGTEIVVRVSDILRGFGGGTQSKAVLKRSPVMISTTRRDGKRVDHFVDVAAAVLMIGGFRSKGAAQQIASVASLIELKVMNVDAESIRPPRYIAGVPRVAEQRPDGVTVKEVLYKLGLQGQAALTYVGKVVGEQYQGESEHWPGGKIYADEDQVARLITALMRSRPKRRS